VSRLVKHASLTRWIVAGIALLYVIGAIGAVLQGAWTAAAQ
jgi:hypothetical protein